MTFRRVSKSKQRWQELATLQHFSQRERKKVYIVKEQRYKQRWEELVTLQHFSLRGKKYMLKTKIKIGLAELATHQHFS